MNWIKKSKLILEKHDEASAIASVEHAMRVRTDINACITDLQSLLMLPVDDRRDRMKNVISTLQSIYKML